MSSSKDQGTSNSLRNQQKLAQQPKTEERGQKQANWDSKDWERAWSMPIDELKLRVMQLGVKKNLNGVVKADLVQMYLNIISDLRKQEKQGKQSTSRSQASGKQSVSPMQKSQTDLSEDKSDKQIKQNKKRKRQQLEQSDSQLQSEHEEQLQRLGKTSASGKHRKIDSEVNNEQDKMINLGAGSSSNTNFSVAARTSSVPAFLRSKTQEANDNQIAQNRGKSQDQSQNQQRAQGQSDQSSSNTGRQNNRKQWFGNKDQQQIPEQQQIAGNESIDTSNQARQKKQTQLPQKLSQEQAKEVVRQWKEKNPDQSQTNQDQSTTNRRSRSPRKLGDNEVLPRGQQIQQVMKKVTQLEKDLQQSKEDNQEWKQRLSQMQYQILVDQKNGSSGSSSQQKQQQNIPQNLTMEDINQFQQQPDDQQQQRLSNDPRYKKLEQAIQQTQQPPLIQDISKSQNQYFGQSQSQQNQQETSRFINSSFGGFIQPPAHLSSQGPKLVKQASLSSTTTPHINFMADQRAPPSQRNSFISINNERPSFVKQRVYEDQHVQGGMGQSPFNMGYDKRSSFSNSHKIDSIRHPQTTRHISREMPLSRQLSRDNISTGPYIRPSKQNQRNYSLSQISEGRPSLERRSLGAKSDDDSKQPISKAFYALLTLVPLIILTTLSIRFVTKGPTYCPNGFDQNIKRRIDSVSSCEYFNEDPSTYQLCRSYKNCIDCPTHGICQEGKFIACSPGYLKEGNRCVENYEINQQANYILREFQYRLQILGGQKKVGEIQYDRLKFSDLEEFANAMKYELQMDDIDKNTLLRKIVTILNSNTGKIKISQLSFVENQIFDINWDPVYMYQFARNRKQKKLVDLLFKQVKRDLQNTVGTISGLSQTDILQRYLQIEKQGDKLSRNENTFNNTVWPELEKKRKGDKQLQVYERLQFGKYIPVWQLK
eukprot:403348215